jgi:hypothetical protein
MARPSTLRRGLATCTSSSLLRKRCATNTPGDVQCAQTFTAMHSPLNRCGERGHTVATCRCRQGRDTRSPRAGWRLHRGPGYISICSVVSADIRAFKFGTHLHGVLPASVASAFIMMIHYGGEASCSYAVLVVCSALSVSSNTWNSRRRLHWQHSIQVHCCRMRS